MKTKKTPSKKPATKGQKPRRLAPVPGSAYELPMKTYEVGEVKEDKRCDYGAVAYCLPPQWEVQALDYKQAMERASLEAYGQSRGHVRNVWVRLKPNTQADL